MAGALPSISRRIGGILRQPKPGRTGGRAVAGGGPGVCRGPGPFGRHRGRLRIVGEARPGGRRGSLSGSAKASRTAGGPENDSLLRTGDLGGFATLSGGSRGGRPPDR